MQERAGNGLRSVWSGMLCNQSRETETALRRVVSGAGATPDVLLRVRPACPGKRALGGLTVAGSSYYLSPGSAIRAGHVDTGPVMGNARIEIAAREFPMVESPHLASFGPVALCTES